MKHLITSICLICISISGAIAQKVKRSNISFPYLQLPLKPLDTSITNYYPTLALDYKDEVDAQEKAYSNSLQEVENEYQIAMKSWLIEKEAIDAKYTREWEAYHSKTTAGKILQQALLEEGEPVRDPYPIAPKKKYIKKPYIPKLFKDEELTPMVHLHGYSKEKDNAVLIEIHLKGFEYSSAKILKSESKKKNDDGTYKVITKYRPQIKYRHPMTVRGLDPTNNIIFDEDAIRTSEYSTYKSAATFNTEYEAQLWWEKNKEALLPGFEENAAKSSIQKINNYVNSQLGYVDMNRTIPVYHIKSRKRKFQYPDFAAAREEAINGYSLITDDERKKESITNLKDAIMIWENAESEFVAHAKQRKLRVNKKVASAALLNIAEAYIWLHDYAKAELQINKIKAIHVSQYVNQANILLNFVRDQKMRHEANNK